MSGLLDDRQAAGGDPRVQHQGLLRHDGAANVTAGDLEDRRAEFRLTPVVRSRLSAAGRVSGPGKFDGLIA